MNGGSHHGRNCPANVGLECNCKERLCFDGRLCRRSCPNGAVCARAYQEVESKTVQQMLEDLVCTIHRDGGHRIAEVGLQKACEEAVEIAARLVQWRYEP